MNASDVNVTEIGYSPTNPRKIFAPGPLAELVASIKAKGIISPVLLRPWPGKVKQPKGGALWELVCGTRRVEAAKQAGLETVPAVIRDLADDEVLDIQLIENIQRADLTPIEEAMAYGAQAKAGRSPKEIAARIGRTEAYVYDRLALLALIPRAQAYLAADHITVSHAIILARLTAKDQERCIGDPEGTGKSALFEREHLLLFSEQTKGPGKPVSVRELQAWVDEHVRFSFTDPHTPFLFPDTVKAATEAAAVEVKGPRVAAITYDHYVQPEAKDPRERTIGPRSWKRADGTAKSPKCDTTTLGVVAVGSHRGEAFAVCLNKKTCTVHWGKEIRERDKAAKAIEKGGSARKRAEADLVLQRDREEQKRAKETATRERFDKAREAIGVAFADAVKKMPATATGALADLIVRSFVPHLPAARKLAGRVPRGRTAESLVRHVAMAILADGLHTWDAFQTAGKTGKALGVNVAKIIEEVAPAKELGTVSEGMKKTKAA